VSESSSAYARSNRACILSKVWVPGTFTLLAKRSSAFVWTAQPIRRGARLAEVIKAAPDVSDRSVSEPSVSQLHQAAVSRLLRNAASELSNIRFSGFVEHRFVLLEGFPGRDDGQTVIQEPSAAVSFGAPSTFIILRL
jgi:hypothetical protein